MIKKTVKVTVKIVSPQRIKREAHQIKKAMPFLRNKAKETWQGKKSVDFSLDYHTTVVPEILM
jgi:hypothetical protein